MEISPNLKDTIRSWLTLAMGEADAEQFMDLGLAVNMVKQDQSDWRPFFSIGAHAACSYSSPETDGDRSALHELVGQAIEPVEASHESLLSREAEQPLEQQQARALFDARFALGFLLLANGDEDRAKKILHEMTATQVSIRGNEVRSGSGILSYTNDVWVGKWVASTCSVSAYLRQRDYREILYLLTEAAACHPGDLSLTGFACHFLDLWAQKCEDEDAAPDMDFPTLNWLDLLAEIAEIVSVCREADSEGEWPDGCKPWSPQFWAWKFGQVAGRFAATDNRWHDDPFGHFLQFIRNRDFENPDYGFQRGADKISQALASVLSLLGEYQPGLDWQKLKDRYEAMWHSSARYRWALLSDIGPNSDLYWAMRLGFADKLIETRQVAVIEVKPEKYNIVRDIETIKDVLSTVVLRQIKEQQEREKTLERLPPSKREIQQSLQKWLIPVWNELPSKVINTIVKAETYYRNEVNDDDAKIWFCKAVEASLNCCLVEPLAGSVEKRDDKRICLCFPPPRGSEHNRPPQLRRLKLWEWSDILEIATAPFRKDLAGLGTADIKEFLKGHFGWTGMPDLRQLCNSLRTVSQCRGGSAHDQDARSRYDRETRKLEEMRNVVLGIDRTSVITQIFQMFRIPGGP